MQFLLLLSLLLVVAGATTLYNRDNGTIVATSDEGLVIWRLKSWQRAARVTGQLTIVLPPNTGDVSLSECFTAVTRDPSSTLLFNAAVNQSCLDGTSDLHINTTLRGPEFYGGYTREAIIFPSRGASHHFFLSTARIEGLGFEYDPTQFWEAKDTLVLSRLGKIHTTRITARWVGQPLVQRQSTLPINASLVCILPPGAGSIWQLSNIDVGAAHTLLIGKRLYTLGAGATVRVLIDVQPPLSLSTILAQWIGDLRDSEGLALTNAPTIVVPGQLSRGALPSCYCDYNVACSVTGASTRLRRIEHLSALDTSALLNGAALRRANLPAVPIAEAVAVFSDRDANIFKWVMIGLSMAFLFWAIWMYLSGPPSTLVPPTLEGLQFMAEVAQPYRTSAEVDDDAIPIPPSAEAKDE